MWERSKALYEKAKTLMPGGVSSPVRAVKPFPFYTERAEGSKIYDVDGNEYIDYCMAYGPLILGHRHTKVMEAVKRRLEDGWLYGTPVELEIKYAELITDIYPSIDMVRFTNTGAEATMTALRLAKGLTGRKKFIKIEGSFHGAHDSVLVKAGSGATTHGVPNSAGIPEEFVANTLQVPYNDAEKLAEMIEKNKEEIAALILEPVMGNASLIIPEDGYLRDVRRITEENDVLLIFDEVITGFRLALGGAQEYYGTNADITTLGKIAGGGFPIGIVGGRKEIMENLSPSGKVYHAGTFSGNPVSLAAGYTTVKVLQEDNPYRKLREKTEKLVKAVREFIEDMKVNVSINSIESMFCLYFGDEPKDYASALKLDSQKFLSFYWKMLENGVFLPPSQYETCFMSAAHSNEDVERTAEVMAECLKKLL